MAVTVDLHTHPTLPSPPLGSLTRSGPSSSCYANLKLEDEKRMQTDCDGNQVLFVLRIPIPPFSCCGKPLQEQDLAGSRCSSCKQNRALPEVLLWPFPQDGFSCLISICRSIENCET